MRPSQGWAIPLQGTRRGITVWFWFLGVVFLSGRLAFLFPHLRKKILSGSLCGFFFLTFRGSSVSCWIHVAELLPSSPPPPQSVYSRLPHLHMWIRSQETFMRVSCVYSWSLVDGTRVTRERTEIKGDGVVTGEGVKPHIHVLFWSVVVLPDASGNFLERKGCGVWGGKCEFPAWLTHCVTLGSCLPALGRVHTGNEKGWDSFELGNVITWSFLLNSSWRTPPWKDCGSNEPRLPLPRVCIAVWREKDHTHLLQPLGWRWPRLWKDVPEM